MARKLRVSLKPQRVNSMLWYYESPQGGSIELYVDLPELCRRDLQSQVWGGIRISKKMLVKSLKRMGAL